MERVLTKYGFRDWDSALAAIGHGGLKEGQVVNKLLEGYEIDHKKAMTDEQIIEAVQASEGCIAGADRKIKGRHYRAGYG